MVIYTERLLLRRVCKTDAEALYEVCKSPNVGPDAGWKPHASLDETRSIMHDVFVMRTGVFAIVERYSARLMGTIGLVNDPCRNHFFARMLGYSLGENYWGKGYATEAARAVINYGFDVLGLGMVSAYCYDFNMRSKHVLQKCGMKYEGTLRNGERRFDGRLINLECYSLLREER